MKSTKSEAFITGILEKAGITFNGSNPWDLQVELGMQAKFCNRIVAEGTLGLGESYMDGWWDCPQIDQFIFKIFEADMQNSVEFNRHTILAMLQAKFFNMQTKTRAKKVAVEHYDLPPEFYMSWLDDYNQYTCGYFKDTDDLNTAQQQKLGVICGKLGLNSNDHVLDIGCGWGGFAKYAAENYGCQVTGITISREQAEYARNFCKGLPVTIEVCDYRDAPKKLGTERFTKGMICGMIEHVGYRNYRSLMEAMHACLKKSGLFLLHTIGAKHSTTYSEPWMEKYIFPNSHFPSLPQLMQAANRLFVLEDMQNFGAYYDPTLMAWHKGFINSWSQFKDQFGDRFKRMWEYYLLACAGCFRIRANQLWHFVLAKQPQLGVYQTVRL